MELNHQEDSMFKHNVGKFWILEETTENGDIVFQKEFLDYNDAVVAYTERTTEENSNVLILKNTNRQLLVE
jgi:hypothetical protein